MKANSKATRETTSVNLEEKFDAGEEVLDYFDTAKARVVWPEIQRVNVDFPKWIVSALDHESARLGITRQALIKIWIAERVQASGAPHGAASKSALGSTRKS